MWPTELATTEENLGFFGLVFLVKRTVVVPFVDVRMWIINFGVVHEDSEHHFARYHGSI